jgi:tRNA(fMet)-specific endonuclease VapC
MAARRSEWAYHVISPVVVDTDVVSYLFKRDTRSALYQPHLDGRLLLISFMTLAELDRWVWERGWGTARRDSLAAHLRNFTVYPYDRALCRRWAQVSFAARRNGRPIQCADAWIAATALLYDAPLLTHNPKDFRGVAGLDLISAADH